MFIRHVHHFDVTGHIFVLFEEIAVIFTGFKITNKQMCVCHSWKRLIIAVLANPRNTFLAGPSIWITKVIPVLIVINVFRIKE